jgi:PPOX class probable F420-dependent enzyme
VPSDVDPSAHRAFTPSAELVEFWTARHLATLTTLRPDGSLHVVPVGVTLDSRTGIARVICSRGSRKARNVLGGDGQALAAVCQVDGRHWSTLEGIAVVRDDQDSVAEAERRYALRYRQPRPNPERVVIEISVRRSMGLA